MSAILQLPDELLLQVQSHFFLADLQNFSGVCRRFSSVAYRRCEEHRALSRKYRRLDACEEPFGWFSHLVTVLRNDEIAPYVKELHIPNCEWYWDELPARDGSITPSAEDFELVSRAARESQWISEKDACGRRAAATNMDHFLQEIGEGDQDNVLAVLVPLLPNLRKIELPAQRYGGLKMGSLPGVMGRIAIATHAAEQIFSDEELPMRSLEEVVGLNHKRNPVSRIGFGVDFEGLAPFLALPSVRKLWTLETHEPMFYWPEELPKSRVREIEFLESSITEQAARALARGIAGPCVMKQDFVAHTHTPRFPPREEWTNLEIPGENSPEREWVITRFG